MQIVVIETVAKICDEEFTDEELAEQINYQHWMTNDEDCFARVKLSRCLSDVIEAINLKLGFFLGHVIAKCVQSSSFWTKPGIRRIR